MADRPFVHLHCHSHYSLLDGASRVPELVARTKDLGMNAIALTDHGNLYGAIEFYRECKAAGLNPIIGYEAYVAPTRRTEREARRRGEAGFHLTLLARNRTGFKNLIKMASAAFLEGYHYVPRIDKELLEAHSEGIICLSGCASSEFSELILKDQLDEAQRLAEWFARVFGKNFYVEIQNNGLDLQRVCADGAVAIANRLGLPLVVTADAHYLCQPDAAAHDVLLCINTGKLRSDANRMRYGSDQFYVRPPEQMYALFPAHADAVKRSQEIADGVEIDLDFKKRHFPVFTPPEGKTPEQHLRDLCEHGVRERYGDRPSQQILDRLELELGIICRMGFASYFLIVSDFVRFAVEKQIPCSARGSACGSLVSYVLKLSHVDPLEYDLLFERFLDPNRSEAPDIDIDFCQNRREEVIAYVRNKYGEGSVAQIATFGTMAARAAIKDVGRVLNLPLERVNQLTKMIPTVLNITLDEALEQSAELKQAYDADPDVREVIDIARKLEGTNRNAGTHAAGVVIANGPLTEYVPLQRVIRKGDDAGARRDEAVITTQWVMGDLEKVGLLKMDFLGLRTLTLLDNAVRMIQKTRGIKIDLYKLPVDDPETYELLQRGDAKGVFQLESDGIRELLKRLKPDNIRDIIALMALYRPGPLEGGMVDSYVNCKHGREKPQYAHPVMEEVLSETYGVMVYQEEIMRILNRLGGIELSSAYACIKAISKKKHEIIDERRAEFSRGAKERGLNDATAKEIFEKIVVFGGYGFNKCLIGATTLVDAVTGEQTTIGDLFANRRAFHVHALGEDGQLRARQVEDVVWNGRKRVYALTTAQGKRIVATSNHPFRTLEGWTPLRDLKPGDRIAAPRRLPVPTTESWPRHEIIALAGLLSEGNTCHPTSLYFFGNDVRLVDDFAEAAGRFPETLARRYQRKNRRIYEVCVNTGRDGRLRRLLKVSNAASTDSGAGNAQKPAPIRCGAFRWAEQLGILGRKAGDKRVPSSVFRLCDADLELFLGRLWAGDGFIANADQFVPFYATSSPGLARDVQTLLARLGIISGVHSMEFKYRDTLRAGYTVHLLGENSIAMFAGKILPHSLGRENQTTLLARQLAKVAAGRSSKDTIPAEVRVWVNEERLAAGLAWTALEKQSGVSVKELLGKGSAKKRGFRRSTIARLAEFFGSRRLANLAASDVFWDRIISIEPLGIEDTYDLTVEEDHNFVADGLIVHNSHTAAYAQVGYQTAYLKTHFRPEFMAALLSSEIEDANKRDILVQHLDDARRLGVEVLPPSVNNSESDFSVQQGKIVFGLTAIKGVGRGAAEEIVRARNGGKPFKDLFDLCERLDFKLVPRAGMERLIKAGAMDCLQGHRAQLLQGLPRAIQAATDRQNDQRLGQGNLFDAFGPGETTTENDPANSVLPEVPVWSETEKLKYEKEALDFYLSSHPLALYEKDLRRFSSHTIADLKGVPAEQEITIGGMLSQVRIRQGKRGGTFAAFTLEDITTSIESVIWSDSLPRNRELVENDQIVVARGSLKRDKDSPILVVTRLLSLEQAAQEMAKELWLRIKLESHRLAHIDSLADILRKTPGSCPVFLAVEDSQGKRAALRLGRAFGVNPATYLHNDLEDLLGSGSVKLR
jgi:DNA polymerase III subunit alpha